MYESVGVDIGPPYSGWLTPDSELDEIEFGVRVCDWLVRGMLSARYSTEKDRIWAVTSDLVSQVASGSLKRFRRIPDAWWPPSAGPRPL